MRSPRFRIETREGQRAFVVAVHGELDLAALPELQEVLDVAERSDVPEIVVDLGGLTFVDSSGVNALIQLHQRIALSDQRLTILHGHPRIWRVFELAGLTTTLPFLP
ncbi:Anti-sigma-B factor antagonist [Paraconexibacter sp. AEG42_29]|uniref:Anti-sigma factor antagonist n=1 Tax=Paraconexibacter sp. AEG42_29 TaxID=2997339 RepID=A0AAU7ARR4_9ACTN